MGASPPPGDVKAGRAAVEGLRVQRDGAVLRLTIDRPDRRNALTGEHVDELLRVLDEAALDDALRCVVLTGSGGHFCSGMDFGHMQVGNGAPPRRTALHRAIDDGAHRLLARLTTLELPVVGAIRGHASGFGLGLALACDFPVAAESARFSAPFVGRGFTPDSGTTWILPRTIGYARAREVLLLGKRLDATQAQDWGLVARVVPDDDLDNEVEALAAELGAAATTAIGLTKWLLHRTSATDFSDALRHESFVEDLSTATKDGREGVKAFMEKRDPVFEGR